MEDEIDQIVEQHGWFCANISDAEIPFLYSIGLLKKLDHPELIVFGLDVDGGSALLSGMVDHIREGRSFTKNGKYRVTIGGVEHEIGLRVVDETKHPLYLGFGMSYCRHIGRWGELEAVQIFWPDKYGKFPLVPGCLPEVAVWQPRSDIPMTQEEIDEFEREYGDG